AAASRTAEATAGMPRLEPHLMRRGSRRVCTILLMAATISAQAEIELNGVGDRPGAGGFGDG
ncbi:MAG: hypothetical protein K9L70_01415, partial [Thiohalocapsa sp.]|nr:hypothetical protein [Thiohalocapsa sp.]